MAVRRADRGPGGSEPTTPDTSSSTPVVVLLGPGVEVERVVSPGITLAIGRAADNDVVVDHPSVSRHHARIHAQDRIVLEALATTNPVRFGGRALAVGERVIVAPGDAFAIGALVGVIRPQREAPTHPMQSVPAGTVVVDPAMIRLYEIVARIAAGDVPVLIEGETGAGKEVVAQAIHLGSPRASRPFVRINCGALPATLVESELFGHARGAFTGADRDKVGLIASADGGSLFLDEVGELPLPLQATLLRVLEDGGVRPLGTTASTPIDVRWIAATNRALAAEVERGRFRKDLYYRLQGFVVTVPPLRERRGEILAIARAHVAAKGRALAPAAEAALLRYPWPGNVRELRNTLASAMLIAATGPIDIEHLPSVFATGAETRGETSTTRGPMQPLRGALAEQERRQIVAALQRTDGNQTRAAKLLGMPRRTLVKRIRDYKIVRGRAVPTDEG